MDAKPGFPSQTRPAASQPTTHAYEQVFPVFAEQEKQESDATATATARRPSTTAPRRNVHLQPTTVSAQVRPPRKANGRSPLFWVNADVQSVKGGSREETLKRIRSHVMSEHNRKKRLENTRRYNKNKTWKNLAFRPDPAATSKSSQSPPTFFTSGSSTSSSSSPEHASSKDSASPESGDDLPTGAVQKMQQDSNTFIADTDTFIVNTAPEMVESVQVDPLQQGEILLAHPWSYIGVGGSDPFNAVQVSVSNSHFQHLHTFLYILVGQAAPFQNHGIPSLQSHWTALIQSSPVLMHSAITLAATHKALSVGVFFADPATQRGSSFILDRLYHRGETIKLINSDLSDPSRASSDALIAAVALMIGIEIVGGHLDWIMIHLNGLRKIVSLRQNFSDIAKHVRWQIEWTDIRAACKKMSQPIFPFIRYTMPEHTPAILFPENAGPLASNLRALALVPGLFGIEMRRTIDDLTSLTIFCEIYKTHKPQPLSSAPPLLCEPDIEEYFNNEVLYIEYTLCNDRFTSFPTHPTPVLRGDDTIEGGVRLAMLLFHNTITWAWYPAVGPIFCAPIFALETGVRNGLAAGNYESAHPLLIWIGFIGYCAAKLIPPSRAFFLDVVISAIKTSNITNNTLQIAGGMGVDTDYTQSERIDSFDSLEDLLQRYFYVPRCYRDEARELWAIIQTDLIQVGLE
ncbi:hypothetical protein BGW36DRAFT_291974 [Talaromyces proteolyticus]|uniref:Transcription factor domain-containing protein n=1 Tax=Talaromyces proteolyticus TaxID=1131652 RepID=A0AAD4Q0J4_9EURO|nr:uncharacterized protein BGW36DRAFT_291974 [Talaromyces proteolyticus]KAH8700894.1 hypothetical protein BGW36DRAFT_291974 [Talaromyces proteolyticus]